MNRVLKKVGRFFRIESRHNLPKEPARVGFLRYVSDPLSNPRGAAIWIVDAWLPLQRGGLDRRSSIRARQPHGTVNDDGI